MIKGSRNRVLITYTLSLFFPSRMGVSMMNEKNVDRMDNRRILWA